MTYLVPPCSQLGHHGRLRASPPHQPVRQGPACRLPDSQPQERLPAPQERRPQVQGQGRRGRCLRPFVEESGAEEDGSQGSGVGQPLVIKVNRFEEATARDGTSSH